REAPVAESVRTVDDRARDEIRAQRVVRQQERIPEADNVEGRRIPCLQVRDYLGDAPPAVRAVERHERRARLPDAVHHLVQRVATRTIGTDTLSDSRSLSPSSAVMGVVRRSWRTLSRLWPRFATKPGTPDATRTSCSSRATTGIDAAPTVSPVSGRPNGRSAP